MIVFVKDFGWPLRVRYDPAIDALVNPVLKYLPEATVASKPVIGAVNVRYFTVVHNRLPRSVFVSHGTRDGVLPVSASRHAIVPMFEMDGYAVEYVEFDGAHEMPADVVDRGLEWFLGRARQSP